MVSEKKQHYTKNGSWLQKNLISYHRPGCGSSLASEIYQLIVLGISTKILSRTSIREPNVLKRSKMNRTFSKRPKTSRLNTLHGASDPETSLNQPLQYENFTKNPGKSSTFRHCECSKLLQIVLNCHKCSKNPINR